MNIGIRLHDVAGSTVEERAALAVAQGFTCVHLAVTKVLSPAMGAPAAATPGFGCYLKRALAPLDVAVLGCYLNLTHPDESVYQKTLDKYIASLRLAKWLGAGVVGTETGNPNAEYRFDPAQSHTEDALKLFIDRLTPVVEAAEKLGQTVAIEPVYKHIVCDGKRARRVLDAIHSPNLQIILDPVNLLAVENLDRRESVIAEAVELLSEDVAVVHIKDYVRTGSELTAKAAGTGEMDYTALAAWIARSKPQVQMTLENTSRDTAESSRRLLEKLLEEAAS